MRSAYQETVGAFGGGCNACTRGDDAGHRVRGGFGRGSDGVGRSGGLGAAVSARAGRGRRHRSALRRRVRVVESARENPYLAPVSGGACRSRHLLRPALRAQSRDARGPRRSHHPSSRDRSRDPGRDPYLYEAVLAEHRSVQQPDGPQVHARNDARRLQRSTGGGGARRGGLPDAGGRDGGADGGADGAVVLRPRVRSHRHEQDAGRGRGPVVVERQQSLQGRVDDRPRAVRRAIPADLPADEGGRPAGRGGLQDRRQIQRRDQRDHPASGGGRAVCERADGGRSARQHRLLPHRLAS